MLPKLALAAGLTLPLSAHAAAGYDPADMSLLWGLPFAFILLSIALFPLFAPKIWHHSFGKITAAWTLLFLLPFTVVYGLGEAVHTVAHAVLVEYIPFILLLWALFTVSGGILVKGNLHGSAKTNTIILALGTVLASLMGTTGAAMLLIRPLLRANDNRKHQVHVVVFFIFLVANIGGGLTPLGDPPLFLGFLKGVDFMWTVKHMVIPVLISSVVLLCVFFVLDSYFWKRENERTPVDPTPDSKLAIEGKINFVWLLGIIGAVLMSGVWKSGVEFSILGTPITLENVIRDIIFILIGIASLKTTSQAIRRGNDFDWGPIQEVGKLFLGIFITIAPVLAMLKVGAAGHFAPLVNLAHNAQGEPINAVYFWLSGMLSAFLDNAPTYLVFFNMASGDAAELMGPLENTLLAVSMGSVFMGALSYIGNAPNFMVKAIAEQNRVKMPSFFGYMGWSFAVLIPLFLLHTLIFFI